MRKKIILSLAIYLLSLNILAQKTADNVSTSSVSPHIVKVACIGNSVTYGYGHENPAETSYPSQLAKMLGDNYEVGNFGKSGATLLRKGHRPYNEQIEYLKSLEFIPDIAIIHLGLNDTDPRNWKYYKREFIADYVALIEDIEKVNPDVEIYICRMSPIFHWHHRFLKGTRDWYWEIQETIENIAENVAEVGVARGGNGIIEVDGRFVAVALYTATYGVAIVAGVHVVSLEYPLLQADECLG